MFIYCKQLECKEALLQAGFKLITEQEQKGSEKIWIFEHNPKLKMPNFEDENIMFMSKKMSF